MRYKGTQLVLGYAIAGQVFDTIHTFLRRLYIRNPTDSSLVFPLQIFSFLSITGLLALPLATLGYFYHQITHSQETEFGNQISSNASKLLTTLFLLIILVILGLLIQDNIPQIVIAFFGLGFIVFYLLSIYYPYRLGPSTQLDEALKISLLLVPATLVFILIIFSIVDFLESVSGSLWLPLIPSLFAYIPTILGMMHVLYRLSLWDIPVTTLNDDLLYRQHTPEDGKV